MAKVNADTDRALNAVKALKVTNADGASAFFYIAQKTEFNAQSAYLLYPMTQESTHMGEVEDHELAVLVHYSESEDDELTVNKQKRLTAFKIDFSQPIQTGDFIDAALTIETYFLEQKSIENAAERANALKSSDAHNLAHLTQQNAGKFTQIHYSIFISKYLGNAKPLGADQSFGPAVADKSSPALEEAPKLPVVRRVEGSKEIATLEAPGSLTLQSVFLGTYAQKLDSKGRVSLPAKFRKATGSDNYVLALVDPSNPVLLFANAANFLQRVEQSQSLSLYDVASHGEELRVDVDGRIVIPSDLRSHLQVEPEDRSVLKFVGRGHFFEVMGQSYWNDNFASEQGVKRRAEAIDALRREL